jgi:hypothetical protein
MRSSLLAKAIILAAASLSAACSDTTGSSGASAGAAGASGAGSGAGTAGTAGNGASGAGGVAVSGAAGMPSSGAGGSSSAGTAGAGGAPLGGGGPGSLVDPKCLDGMAYAAEPVPDRSIDVDDLIASYDPKNLLQWTIDILKRRYPIGALGPMGAQADNDLPCFEVAFDSEAPTVQEALDALNTVVHECGHRLDGSRWVIRTDLEYVCNEALMEGTPARNVIMEDEFEQLGPKGDSLDFLEEVYLEGDSGKQNFAVFYTEYSQYVNQMGSAYAYYDKTKEYNVADGSRGFAWWLERYLRILRTSHADDYAKITGDACWRQLMLSNWGRMVRRWDEIRKANMTEFAIDETFVVEGLVMEPQLLAEIENLRVLDGCRK